MTITKKESYFVEVSVYTVCSKKEGNKVNNYYAAKKGIFGSTLRFIPTTTFFIYIKFLVT